MASVAIAYTTQDTSTTYNVVFNQFTDDTLPRSYVGQVDFTYSSKGTSLVSGPGYTEKRIWAISSLVITSVAETLDTLYREWDQDRAAGYPAAIGLIDETFGATISTSVIVSTAPTFVKTGPKHYTVSIGLTEV